MRTGLWVIFGSLMIGQILFWGAFQGIAEFFKAILWSLALTGVLAFFYKEVNHE